MAAAVPSIRSLQDVHDLEASAALPLDRTPSTYALLQRSAEVSPDATALSFFLTLDEHDRPHRWSYAEWLVRITQAAHLFRRLGIGRHDVVVFVLPNLPETHWTIWGGETAGVVMAINPMLEPATMRHLMATTRPRLVVTLAPMPGQDLWEKVCTALEGVDSITALLAVSPGRYLLNDAQRAALAPSAAVPTSLRGMPVIDFHDALSREDGKALTFELPGLDDVASYFCTGGTTGMPKIAVRTHRTEVANALQLSTALATTLSSPEATVFSGLPLFHVNAQIITGLAIWASGAHVLLGTPLGYRTPGLIARFWELVARHRLVTFSAVPTVYAALLQSPRDKLDTSSLRFGLCGAAPMPRELFQRFTSLTGVNILEGYGLTECGCVSTVNPPDGEARIGSIGLRLPWQEVRIARLGADGAYLRDAEVEEVGALVVRGPNVFKGYLDPRNNEKAWVDRPAEGGRTEPWFDTGDLGRVDADGYFWLSGRTKELIIRAGHNIDPQSIEEALCAHPAVALAAAIGRPDAHAGEVPVAYVQLRPGASATEEALTAFAHSRISERAAVPKAIHILDALPTTAVGKLFKPALVEREILDVVRKEATAAAVTLTALSATQEPRYGWEVHWAASGARASLRDRLAAYTFAQCEHEAATAPPTLPLKANFE
jgi:fatty-acyl-CoA synthase/long-chain acyl-CoA synthetase